MAEYEGRETRLVKYEGLQIAVNQTADGRLIVPGSIARVGSTKAVPIIPGLEPGVAQAIFDAGLEGDIYFRRGRGPYRRSEAGKAELTPTPKLSDDGIRFLMDELGLGEREDD